MVFAGITLLTSSTIADALSGTPKELEIITTFRYIGFALALVHMILLLLPKEYPYPPVAKVRFKDVFMLPLKNKKFMKKYIFRREKNIEFLGQMGYHISKIGKIGG